MSKKILFMMAFIVLMILMLAPTASAKDYHKDKGWDWCEVNYTQLDYRAMGFLWDSWLVPEAGKVAILPFTDFSAHTILSDPLGGGDTPAARRVAEMIGYQFTRLGLIPIPYDDSYGSFMNIIGQREDINLDTEARDNNSPYIRNKSDDMMRAIKEAAPGILSSMKQPGEGVYLSKEEIMSLGEMLSADLIVRGSLSEYGTQKKLEGNWRTFIPPFLGLFNKDTEGMIEASIYMYDAHSGELVWSAYEEVEVQPTLPLFQTDFEVMDSAESLVALKLISHLVAPPPEHWEGDYDQCPGPCGY